MPTRTSRNVVASNDGHRRRAAPEVGEFRPLLLGRRATVASIEEGAQQLVECEEFREWVESELAAEAAVALMSRSKRNGVWIDEGPSSAAARDPLAVHQRPVLPGSAPTGGAGRIERRQITQAEIEARARDVAGVPVTRRVEPEAEPEEEETVSDEPVQDVSASEPSSRGTAIRELAAAAVVADDVWTRYEAAQRALSEAADEWSAARADLEQKASAFVGLVDVGPIGPGPTVVESRADHSETIPERDDGLMARARALSPVDRLAKPAAGGGPGPRAKNARGLTRRQEEVLGAVKRHGGDRRAAATELNCAYQSIDVILEGVGKKGLLPQSLIQQLPARFAKYTGI